MSTPEAPSRAPCTPWITSADVAAVCTIDGTADAVYDTAAQVASDVLFELSGRQFPGLCERTVRPCASRTCPPTDPCGCCHVSRVPLAGYPVRAVTEVKIDGGVLGASGYRLDRNRWLVRMAGEGGERQQWPGCQRLDLDDTEANTFAVTYEYGAEPPAAGLLAAQEFACQIAGYLPAEDCGLPAGTTRIVRQGITIDIGNGNTVTVPFGPLTTLFLDVYNPSGLRRPPALYSPDIQQFPQTVGT